MFFSRAQYYGEHDDFKRFSYFSRAALELLYQSGKKVDIIHCHDWQTAFVVSVKDHFTALTHCLLDIDLFSRLIYKVDCTKLPFDI